MQSNDSKPYAHVSKVNIQLDLGTDEVPQDDGRRRHGHHQQRYKESGLKEPLRIKEERYDRYQWVVEMELRSMRLLEVPR